MSARLKRDIFYEHPSSKPSELERRSLVRWARSRCTHRRYDSGIPDPDGRLFFQLRSPYEVSAVLSAHIETATLPLRLGHLTVSVCLSSFASIMYYRLKSPTALAQLCKQSNFFGNTPFAELCGAFPVLNAELLDQHTYNFTGFQSDVRVESCCALIISPTFGAWWCSGEATPFPHGRSAGIR